MKRCMGCMKEMEDHLSVCPHCGYDEKSSPKEGYYLHPGTVIAGKYIIGRVLGYGGFGITYIGWDQVLSRRVAIKEYFPSSCVTREPGSRRVMLFSRNVEEEFTSGLASFTKEARRLAQLNKLSGVVRIYDCVEDCGTGYIVMEFLEGMNAKELLKRKKRLPYEEAKGIIVEVLKTLSAVHDQQIIHRDISPDNIFLTTQGVVRLIDFGAARYVAGEHSRTLTVILKPGYAPEEQYLSHGDQGPWTDVYSTAACFYRMITGSLPKEAIIRMDEDEPLSISAYGVEIPPAEEAAILKALSVHREDRFQTAREFLEALTRPPVSTAVKVHENRPEKRAQPPREKSGRLTLPMAAAAGVLVLIILAAVFFLKRPVKEEETKEQKTETAVVSLESEKTEEAAEETAEEKIFVPDPQPGPVSETVEPGLYVITTGMDMGKALHIVGDSTTEGASLELKEKDGSGFQIFRIEADEEGTFKITCDADQDYSLTVKNDSDEAGAFLQMRPYKGSAGQKWEIRPCESGDHYVIVSVLGNCLDCYKASAESGTKITMWKTKEHENQLWDLVKVG